MLTMLLRQLLATLCGVVIPRVMIGAFGSEVYGATTSIAQFLSYVSLLEGGIGRVARGALYKHFAEGDETKISGVHRAIRSFFRNIGIFYLLYAVVLAFVYHDIANITEFDREYTFLLVLAISLSTVITYFIGVSNMTLMHADQKQYLTNTVITVTNIINTLCIVLLVKVKAEVLTVKLVSSIVFIARPVFYAWYVRRNYHLPKVGKSATALSQKWTGIGQHMAYFLHTNTDVVMLTILADLKTVAVYSVYHLVVNSIWNIASSLSGGMEAAFGEMIAKREQRSLKMAYRNYKCILMWVSLMLFGCAGVLIIPFVRLYVKGITDADYIQPTFAMLLLLSEFMNCISLPCSTLPISAYKLKKTRWGAYGEALINITVSLALIRWNPLLGVAIGTLAATVFKSLYYMAYAAKNHLECSSMSLIAKFVASVATILGIGIVGMIFMKNMQMANYLVWALWGMATFAVVAVIATTVCCLLFPNEMKPLIRRVCRVLCRRKGIS